MLAEMAHDAPRRRELCLMASHYCERAVTTAVRAANLHRAARAFKDLLPVSAPVPSEPEPAADPKAKGKDAKKAPAAAPIAAPLVVEVVASSSAAPVATADGPLPTTVRFDDKLRESLAAALAMDPTALTAIDLGRLAVELIESAASDSAKAVAPTTSTGAGAAVSQALTILGWTAATIPGAPYFTAPSSFADWSRWTPSPALVRVLGALPDEPLAFAPSQASYSKLPLTVHHLHALTSALTEEGCHLQVQVERKRERERRVREKEIMRKRKGSEEGMKQRKWSNVSRH